MTLFDAGRRLTVRMLLALAPIGAAAQVVRVAHGKDVVEVEAVEADTVRIHVEPDGIVTARTLVIDPAFQPGKVEGLKVKGNTIATAKMSVVVNDGATLSIVVKDAAGHVLLTFNDPVSEVRRSSITMLHDAHEEIYGMRGLTRDDTGGGILRTSGATTAQGVQGDGGAPLFFTKHYGVLVDSDGGMLEPHDEVLRFRHDSRGDAEFFVAVGPPMETISAVSRLMGRPPMSPKWTLGFLNSQWGSTEAELRDVAKTYAAKQIPISGFILDFDWKAWGEDNYGEWRWNSTSGKGNPFPDKFPNGASGKFGAEMQAQGIHLTGILKPRILVNTVDGTPTQASAYATAHNFWYPGEKRENDYFTHRLAGNIDFGKPDARAWYWEHLVPSFRTGITGWWNDEADYTSTTVFNNFQFLNMSRALYDGQRSISPERVWSINRAYYAGSNRYGAAEWSGDIATGFPSMAYQRRRMVAALDTGLTHWSMDTGGFQGHPTNENYARWIEFAAFVPIFRVHGDHNDHRQPWVYGPIAEAAAKRAMRLRYDLLPYLYANERLTAETGVSIVHPLFWEFPDDPKVADDTQSWMFGDALLVSPVVEQGATTHTLYLPAGAWFDYWTGKPVEGGQELSVPADATAFEDIPLFVRAGSIVATQPATSGNDLDPKVPLVLDVFPSAARKAEFAVYDDDGHTYAYEKGEFFKQKVVAEQRGAATEVKLRAVEGRYRSTIPGYVLRVHRTTAAISGGKLRKFASQAEFANSNDAGWTTGQDRFGAVTLIRLGTGIAATMTLR